MSRLGILGRIGSQTKTGRTAGTKAMNLSKPAGMRGSMATRYANRNSAYTRHGMYYGGAAAGMAGLMYRGRDSSSQRGGYSPPRLREPRGSGRYA